LRQREETEGEREGGEERGRLPSSRSLRTSALIILPSPPSPFVSGIGLSLTSELVHLHGAQILVSSSTAEESSDGSSGSTFTVLFPFGKDHLPADQVDDMIDASTGGSSYAKGIVEEAGLWKRSGNSSSQRSLSDSGMSGVDGIQTISSLLWNR